MSMKSKCLHFLVIELTCSYQSFGGFRGEWGGGFQSTGKEGSGELGVTGLMLQPSSPVSENIRICMCRSLSGTEISFSWTR